jgi:hypothetical protein
VKIATESPAIAKSIVATGFAINSGSAIVSSCSQLCGSEAFTPKSASSHDVKKGSDAISV